SRLGQRFEQSVVIDAHLDVPLKPASGHIASNRDYGRSIQPSAADARREIGSARPESGYANAGYTCEIAHRCGHETRGGFIGRENELNGTSSQRFDERQDRSTGNAKDPAYPGLFQHAHKKIRVFHMSPNPERVE